MTIKFKFESKQYFGMFHNHWWNIPYSSYIRNSLFAFKCAPLTFIRTQYIVRWKRSRFDCSTMLPFIVCWRWIWFFCFRSPHSRVVFLFFWEWFKWKIEMEWTKKRAVTSQTQWLKTELKLARLTLFHHLFTINIFYVRKWLVD